MEYIITFTNTNYTMKAERALLDYQLQVGVLPLPSQLSAGCGLCLRIKPEEIQLAKALLLDAQVGDIEFYLRTVEMGRYSYQREERV